MAKIRNDFDSLASSCKANLLKGKDPLTGLKPEQIEALQTRYSTFSDESDENGFLVKSTHVIHDPITPRPYFHALHNFSFAGTPFGTLWDQTGRGHAYLNAVTGGEITKNSGSPYKPFHADKYDRR